MNLPPNVIPYIILHEFKKGSSESQAEEIICAIYGEGFLKEKECQAWYARFRSGDQSLEEPPGTVENKGKPMKRKLEGTAEGRVVVAKKAKRTEIVIANDVLRKILGWIKLKELPNIALTKRRYWQICDENLDGRKRRIKSLRIVNLKGSGGERIMDKKGRTNGLVIFRGQYIWQAVPFAEVEPPMNFTMNRFWVHANIDGNYDESTMRFLRASKPLFDNACLDIYLKRFNEHFGILDDEVLATLDNCYKMRIFSNNQAEFNMLFKKLGIFNYTRIDVEMERRVPGISTPINTVFKWLHTLPTTAGPEARRQISFTMKSLSSKRLKAFQNSFTRLVNRFLKDRSPHTFLIRLIIADAIFDEIELLENPSTAEVFFSREIVNKSGITTAFELVRCSKEEEESIEYGKMGSIGNRPHISLYA